MPGLEIQHLRKAFARVRVLDDVSLSAPPGTITGVLGPNGAGKSTLFHCVLGLCVADGGSVCLDGRQLLGLPVHRMAAAGLAFLPQDSSSFPELSVAENLQAILEILPIPRAQRRARLHELLDLTGLLGLADRGYEVLSGGEKRRVEVAKALASAPRMLLLDEPFAGLDPHAIDDLSRVLAERAHAGIGVLLTDHNVHTALALVEHAWLLGDGRVLCHGTPEELRQHPLARRHYLGEGFP